jgi:hypothetical protein
MVCSSRPLLSSADTAHTPESQRILEWLSYLRELFVSEFCALFVDELPTALHNLCVSLQASALLFVTCLMDDALKRRRRHRHMKCSPHVDVFPSLICLGDDDTHASMPQGELLWPRELLPLVHLEMMHDELAWSRTSAQVPADDASSSALVAGSLSCLPEVAQEKPLPSLVEWETTNSLETLRESSGTDSGIPSVVSSEIGEPLSTIFEAYEIEIAGMAVMPLVCRKDNALRSTASSLNLLTSGVTYRQLIEEIASCTVQDTEKTPPPFYRAALSKLKQERELRARLRTTLGGNTTTVPMTASSLRPMRVTPLTPKYEADDGTRRLRKKKLDNLRQRSTRFAIAVGKPLNYTNFNDLPEDDVGPCFV